MLGRIFDVLSDVMDQRTLMAYLFQCNKSIRLFVIKFKEGNNAFPWPKVTFEITLKMTIDSIAMSLSQKYRWPLKKKKKGGTSKTQFPDIEERSKLTTSPSDCKLEAHVEVVKSINAIIARVNDI